jgi:homoserine O-acetyltransferase
MNRAIAAFLSKFVLGRLAGAPLTGISEGRQAMRRAMQHLMLVVATVLVMVGIVWLGSAESGAPAPAPTGTGPHLPEHQIANLGDFRFENGMVVKDFKVSYVTHGKLNRTKDNAILVMHHSCGDHHNYDFMIGPGKPFDTDRYFIVATDTLGNGKVREDVTTGPTNSGLRMDFPRYSLRDSVNLEYRLLKEYLGLDRVLAVSGISVGALKAFQFGVSYPTYMRAIIPIAGDAVTRPRTKMMVRDWLDIIALDSGWQGGNYETTPVTGLWIVFRNIAPWVFTHQWLATNLKTADAYQQFMQGSRAYWLPQDARDVYFQLQSWAEFNVGDSAGFKGDSSAALRSIKTRTLIIGFKEDQMFDRRDLATVRDTIPGASLVDIESPAAHAGCCGNDPEATKIMSREISALLSKVR